MKRTAAIVTILASVAGNTSIQAGDTSLDVVDSCLLEGKALAGCIRRAEDIPAAKSDRAAACIQRRGFDGKTVTAKQWLGCGLPKRGLSP
jgi:hypothetical protein